MATPAAVDIRKLKPASETPASVHGARSQRITGAFMMASNALPPPAPTVVRPPPGGTRQQLFLNGTPAAAATVEPFSLAAEGELRIGERFRGIIDEVRLARAAVAAGLAFGGAVDLASFRELAAIGRNIAIEVLELFDRSGLTRRAGGERRLVRSVEAVFGTSDP